MHPRESFDPTPMYILLLVLTALFTITSAIMIRSVIAIEESHKQLDMRFEHEITTVIARLNRMDTLITRITHSIPQDY